MEQDTEIKFTDAMAQLEAIIEDLKNEKTDIDTMVAKTRRATELIKLCRQRLKTTGEALDEALAALTAEA